MESILRQFVLGNKMFRSNFKNGGKSIKIALGLETDGDIIHNGKGGEMSNSFMVYTIIVHMVTKKILVRESTGSLEILPKHREFCLLKF